MVKRLFIAEKPSVARYVSDLLARDNKLPIQKGKTEISVGNDTVTWCVGHILEMFMPNDYSETLKLWKLADLPITPNPWKLKPKENTKGQLSAIDRHIRSHDEVWHLGDPDEEGQLLVDEALIYLGNRLPVKRMWLSALNDESIRKAIEGVKSNDEYIGVYEYALARSRADWSYGINLTRAVTLSAKKRGSSTMFSVGRVQTPTLALVVNREIEIENFKSVSYYIPWLLADTTPSFRAKWRPPIDDARVDGEGRLVDKRVADELAQSIKQSGQASVTKCETKNGSESPPLPFSLSALQIYASKKFGLGAEAILKIAQGLYEKKIITYPRTDSDYLPESQHTDAGEILRSLASSGISEEITRASKKADPGLKSRAWNDKNVTAHHAMAPLPITPSALLSLVDVERKIYAEIVKRFIVQFWPSAQFMETSIELACARETFAVNGRRYIDDGWKSAFSITSDGDDDESEQDGPIKLPELKRGQVIKIKDSGLDSEATKAPKRFNEGTLIGAMKNIHNFVKDPKIKAGLKDGSGIGTEATRANTIETLFSREFMAKKGKNLVPTDSGRKLILALPIEMSAPDLTALWQAQMGAIKSRSIGIDDFLDGQLAWISDMVAASGSFFDGVKFESKINPNVKETNFVCPSCSAALRHVNGKFGWFFGCSNRDCGKMMRDVGGVPTEKMAPAPSGHPESAFSCPACKNGFLRSINGSNGTFWGCSGYKEGCRTTFDDANGSPNLVGR